MDTINNLTTAASKAIWGETKSHEEPVSGKMGDVSAGEPYDAGNIGKPNEAAMSSAERKVTGTGTERTDTERTGTERFGAGRTAAHSSGTETSSAFPTAKTNEPSTVTPAVIPSMPTSATETAPTQTKPGLDTNPLLPQEQSKERETRTTPKETRNPAAEAPSAITMRDDSTKAQNDTRPPPASADEGTKFRTGTKPHIPGTTAGTCTTDEISSTASTTGNDEQAPSTVTSTTATADEDEDDLKQTRDAPVKISGPGPRPLEEIAREHGGNAGAVGGAHSSLLPGEEEGAGTRGVGGVEGGGVGGGERRRDSAKSLGEGEGEGKGKGSGEEYVKSSGLNADGGDFDAARPGAGREADRLLEEKGVMHKPGPAGAGASEQHHAGHHGTHLGGHHGAGGEGGGKVGLKEKIKAKLHKSSTST